MEYTTRKRYTVKQQDNVLLELYPHDIQFYNKKPTGEVSLKDFQDLGLERKQGTIFYFSFPLRMPGFIQVFLNGFDGPKQLQNYVN